MLVLCCFSNYYLALFLSSVLATSCTASKIVSSSRATGVTELQVNLTKNKNKL